MDKHLIELSIKAVLIIVASIFIFILIVKRFLYFRPSLHFLPTRENYQEINNGHLNGWLLPGPNRAHGEKSKIILLCHGNGGNISHKEEKMISMRIMGYSVFVFDYSGYGKSGGVPSEQQLYDDASAIVALFRQTYQPEQIILYGESLGGPIATYVARRYSIPTLILESPLPSIKAVIETKYPMISFLSFLFPEFDTASYLNGYKGKSLLMHSHTDDIIPYESIKNLIMFSTEHIVIEGSHNNPIIPWDKIKIFLEK